jgi:hypothetical protein
MNLQQQGFIELMETLSSKEARLLQEVAIRASGIDAGPSPKRQSYRSNWAASTWLRTRGRR